MSCLSLEGSCGGHKRPRLELEAAPASALGPDAAKLEVGNLHQLEHQNADAKRALEALRLEQEIGHAMSIVQLASEHHRKLLHSAAELESALQRSRKDLMDAENQLETLKQRRRALPSPPAVFSAEGGAEAGSWERHTSPTSQRGGGLSEDAAACGGDHAAHSAGHAAGRAHSPPPLRRVASATAPLSAHRDAPGAAAAAAGPQQPRPSPRELVAAGAAMDGQSSDSEQVAAGRLSGHALPPPQRPYPPQQAAAAAGYHHYPPAPPLPYQHLAQSRFALPPHLAMAMPMPVPMTMAMPMPMPMPHGQMPMPMMAMPPQAMFMLPPPGYPHSMRQQMAPYMRAPLRRGHAPQQQLMQQQQAPAPAVQQQATTRPAAPPPQAAPPLDMQAPQLQLRALPAQTAPPPAALEPPPQTAAAPPAAPQARHPASQILHSAHLAPVAAVAGPAGGAAAPPRRGPPAPAQAAPYAKSLQDIDLPDEDYSLLMSEFSTPGLDCEGSLGLGLGGSGRGSGPLSPFASLLLRRGAA